MSSVPRTHGQDLAPEILVQPRAHPPTFVKDRPFQATFESTSEKDGVRRTARGKMYRDAEGRRRFECCINVEERIVLVSDNTQGCFLDETVRKAYCFPSALVMSGWAFSNVVPIYTDEYREINGVECRRVSLNDATSKVPVGETFISETLGIVLSDSGVSNGAVLDWHVTELSFESPIAALFEIPKDYEIVNLEEQ